MPYGISPAPEIFQQKLTQCLEGLSGVHIVADDVLIVGKGETIAEANKDHDNNLKEFVERCRSKNITLNKSKFEYKADTIRFIGHVLTSEGLKSDPNKLKLKP